VGKTNTALVDAMLDWKRKTNANGGETVGTVLLGMLWWTLMVGGVLGVVFTVLLIIMSYPILALFAFMAFVWRLALKDS